MDNDRESWAGLADPAERRKLQNKLNKRAERKRRAYGAAANSGVPALANPDTSALQFEPSIFEHGESLQALVLRQPPAAFQNIDNTTHLPKSVLLRKERKWAPKTRSGCVTCNYSGLATATTSLWEQPSTLQGLCHGATPADQEAFYAMRSFILNDAVGTYDQQFWVVDVIHAAQVYPAVWHAVLAFTEQYRSTKYLNISHPKHLYYQIRAEEHYSRTVQSVRDVVGQAAISLAEKAAVLISSILLLGFSCLTEDNSMKLSHLNSAFEIFNRLPILDSSGKGAVSGSAVSSGGLIRQIQRFRVQCAGSTIPGLSYDAANLRVISEYDSFTSVTDAYTEALNLGVPVSQAARASIAAAEAGDPIPDTVRLARLRLKKWQLKFLTFLRTGRTKIADEEGILTLQIWSIVMEILLFLKRHRGCEAELEYDAWAPSFGKLAALIEQLHAVITRSVAARQPMLSVEPFSFTSFTASSLVVFTRYRNGPVRRKVANILRQWPFHDGIADVARVGAIIEAVTQVEEEGFLLQGAARPESCRCVAPQYICAFHRCREYQIEQNMEGRAIVHMFLWADWREPLVEREVPISWPYLAGQ